MFQQSHFITVVRIRTSCLQLFITSVWEYLKVLIVHGPNHEVMITANKVLRALSSHCSQSGGMRIIGASQQWAASSCLSKDMLFSEVPDWARLLFLNKQQQLSWSLSCTQANSLKSLVFLQRDLFLALVKKKHIWSVTGRRPFFPPSSCAFHISLNCISYHQCAREASCGDVKTPPSRLCVMKELLLLGDLEQRLEWAQAASLGETFLFLNRVKGQWQPSDSSNQSGTQEQFQQKDPK